MDGTKLGMLTESHDVAAKLQTQSAKQCSCGLLRGKKSTMKVGKILGE